MRLCKAAIALLVLALVSPIALAQATGGLTVNVLDEDSAPLPGATVMLSHETGNVAPTASPTNKKGQAVFPVLQAGGGYVIDVSFPGFGKRRETGIRVQIGQQTQINIQLAAELVERVEVTAEAQVVDLKKTTSSAKFTDEFVQDLPVAGRFYQNILTLAPGVNDADGDGNPNVHGSRSRDFQAQVGGVSQVDPLTGQSIGLVNPNSIEEMEVITGGAGVEFGRAQGGFANIIQKQGTNEFEGVFDFLWRSSRFDGTGANDISNLPDPEFDTLQPSLSFSGPIIRDKVWFRLNHDLIDREDPVNTVGGFELRQQERSINADQITWQVSPRNKLVFQYATDIDEITNFGVSSFTPGPSAFAFDRDVSTTQLNWQAPYSTRILIDTTAAFQIAESGISPNQPSAGNECVADDPFLSSANCLNQQTGQVTGAGRLDREARSERLTVKSQATIYGGQFWGGTHQFNLGLDIQNERYFQRDQIAPGITFVELNFADNSDEMVELDPTFIAFTNLSVPADNQFRATGNNWALYFQDQYRPFSNTTFTIGLRIDREEVTANGRRPFDPSTELGDYEANLAACQETAPPGSGICFGRSLAESFTFFEDTRDFLRSIGTVVGLQGDQLTENLAGDVAQTSFWNLRRRQENIDIGNTNFSPFFSVRWDPFSNGKTAFGASYRRYYDKIFLQIPVQEQVAPQTNVAFTLTQSEGGTFSNPTVRGSIQPSVTVNAVDRDLRTPYQDEIVLSFEREVFTETSVRVEYVNRRYRDQFQDIDINRAPGDFGACRRPTFTNNSPIVDAAGLSDPNDPSTFITDPYTGEQYLDTDPGIGDGRIDDCAGDIVESFGGAVPENPLDRDVRLERPDGVPDLYIQNPAWGSVFFVSNVNEADYESFIVSLTRRQYRSWEMQASYTWAFATGNGEDFQQGLGDDQSLTDDEFGFQSTDQRHVVRLNATTITPWGIRLGGAVRWESGLPFSLQEARTSFAQVTPSLNGFGGSEAQTRIIFPTGQRNDQRNESFWNVDLKATKEMNIARGLNLQISAEIFNALNDDTLQVYNPDLEIGRQVNGVNDAIQRFGRQWQLGMKLAF